MSAESLITQEEKVLQYNISNAPRISAGAPLSKMSLASYKRNDMGKASENLSPLWEIVKNDPPVYRDIERAFLPTNHDAKGLLFESHLQKYWRAAPADKYKSAFYQLRKFLDWQKSRHEPARDWDLGRVLIFSERRRTIRLEEYDLRVKKAGEFLRKTDHAHTKIASK